MTQETIFYMLAAIGFLVVGSSLILLWIQLEGAQTAIREFRSQLFAHSERFTLIIGELSLAKTSQANELERLMRLVCSHSATIAKLEQAISKKTKSPSPKAITPLRRKANGRSHASR